MNGKTLVIGGPASGKSSLIEYRAISDALNQGKSVIHFDNKRLPVGDYIEFANCESSINHRFSNEDELRDLNSAHFIGDFYSSPKLITIQIVTALNSSPLTRNLVQNLLFAIKGLSKGCLIVVNDMPCILAGLVSQMHNKEGYDNIQIIGSLLSAPTQCKDVLMDSDMGFQRDEMALFHCPVWSCSEHRQFFENLLTVDELNHYRKLKKVRVVQSKLMNNGNSLVRLKGSYLKADIACAFEEWKVDTHVVYRGRNAPSPVARLSWFWKLANRRVS